MKKKYHIPSLILISLIAIAFTVSLVVLGDRMVTNEIPIGVDLLCYFLFLELHIIIHEAGHLVFGLLSGYKFSSFRVGNIMLVKINDKFKLKRYSLAGTGGQCLMCPPDPVDGKYPLVLYNLGGSIMNALVASAFLIPLLIFDMGEIAALVCLYGALSGYLFSILNGIPLRYGTTDNDGYNAIAIRKNKEATRAFWIQLKVNEMISNGCRVKDMPAEWFAVPSDESMSNSIVAAQATFTVNWLMDQHRFKEADALMDHLLAIDSGLVDMYRHLMICERMYCEIMEEGRQDVLEAMRCKKQLAFMKQMKSFPSVIRVNYLYALLIEKNEDSAAKAWQQFEKVSKTYPYVGEIAAERELIELAKVKYVK